MIFFQTSSHFLYLSLISSKNNTNQEKEDNIQKVENKGKIKKRLSTHGLGDSKGSESQTERGKRKWRKEGKESFKSKSQKNKPQLFVLLESSN